MKTHFDLARGSAPECAVCLDVSAAKKRMHSVADGKAVFLARSVSMFVALIRSMSASRVYAGPATYCAGTAG
jgi:hypothetical protein